jgi:hypothetical protein
MRLEPSEFQRRGGNFGAHPQLDTFDGSFVA